MISAIKRLLGIKPQQVDEAVTEEPQETDAELLARIDRQMEKGITVPDAFTKKQCLVGYYYLQCRVHGFYISQERAEWFLDRQQHIIGKVQKHAERIDVE